MSRILLSGIALYFFILSPSWAQSTPAISSDTITLGAVLEIVRKENPEIKAARKEWEAAKAKVLSEKTWPDPQVGVEYWGFRKSSLNVSESPERWYDISQEIPFPGKLYWRGKAAKHGARREEGLYQATEREVLAQVKEAYYGLMVAERATEIFKENLEIIRRFAKVAESKYASGKATQSDALRAQVELSKMLNMRLTVDQERETAQARLNSLLDRHPEEPLRTADEPSLAPLKYSFQELEQLAMENRPEVHAASHHVDHMKAELAAMRADYLPDTMVQYTLRKVEGQETDAIAMFKADVPLWFWRQGSLVNAAKREKEHADAMLRSAKTMTRYEVKEFLVQVQTSQRLVELYKTTVLPQAEQSLKVTEAGYRSDRIGFLDLLDSQRALVEFQLEYYQYLGRYGSSLAQLERVVGVDLSKEKP